MLSHDRNLRPTAFIRAVLIVLSLMFLDIGAAHSAAPPVTFRPATAAAPNPNSRVILLENRTYTVMWFRARDGGGKWSEWTKLLPGGRLNYPGRGSMTIDVAQTGGQQRQFTLSPGSTYQYVRSAAKALPQFAIDSDDRARGLWKRPTPPQADEFRPYANVSYGNSDEMFKPLERFMDRCQQNGDAYKLSLKKLALECYLAQEQAGGISNDLRYLKGFTWFFGYMVDKANDDVILLGVKDPTRPPIDLDCLATAIMAAHFDLTPRCSLDAHPDPRYQKSVVGGVPWNTKWAEIMIDADYVMKKVGQGQINPHIAGLVSQFDRKLADRSGRIGQSSQEDRFWFNFDSSVKRSLISRDGSLAVMYRNPVIVSTEKNIGGKYGTGATDGDAFRFANEFTRNMETLGKHYQSVGELIEIFRLHDLFFHLKQVGRAEAPALKYWIDLYQRPYAGPPREVSTLTRKQTVRWSDSERTFTRTLSVEGGVSMQLGVNDQSLQMANDDEGLKARILRQ